VGQRAEGGRGEEKGRNNCREKREDGGRAKKKLPGRWRVYFWLP
jgi:hypothetical protein